MRILCVAEKPSQARSIAQILSEGRFRTREGKSRYNKNFDFEYRINGTFIQTTMTSVAGHILELDFPAAMRSWHSCNPEALFSAPVIKQIGERIKDVAINIEREARSATHLYIWTDCDREGEGIGNEIASLCYGVNSRITVKRAHFSSVLPQEIHGAMQSPRELDHRLVSAVEARTEMDLRIGAAFTRFQTLRLQSRFSMLKDKKISYGPCQFPTLGFVVDQFLRVENFVPETFWFLFLQHEINNEKAVFKWKRNRVFDKETCFVLYSHCMTNPIAHVSSVRSRPKEKWRPLPLTTVELQAQCSKYLRISTDVIMNIAEKLYNKGYISYPRTETDQFDRNMDLRGIVSRLAQYHPFSEYTGRLVNGGFCWPRQGKNNDKSHPPIHPVAPANNLTGDAKRIYEFIMRHFLACCSDNAKGQSNEVLIEVCGERFFTNGLSIVARNYLDIYPYDKWSESTVPLYRQGESFEPTVFEMRTGTTTGPKLLQEHDLVKMMEKNGIGTDATHAEHIKKIIEREYIFKSPDGFLHPSTLGIGLVEGYDAIGLELSLSKPYLRREMEQDLRLICDGVKSKEDVIRESVRLYCAVYKKSVCEIETIEHALTQCFDQGPDIDARSAWVPRGNTSSSTSLGVQVHKCPVCDGALCLRERSNGGWLIGCDHFPQCKKAIWVPDFVRSISVSTEDCPLCASNPKGPSKLLGITFAPGSAPPGVRAPYYGCVRGCDELINELFQIIPLVAAPSSAISNPPSHSTSSDISNHRRQHPSPLQNQGQPYKDGGGSSLIIPPLVQRNNATETQNSQLSGNPACNCRIPTVRLTVQKEGPNKGRGFFRCNKGQGEQCGFFEWADQPTTTSGLEPYTSPFASSSVPEQDKPKCKCGLLASLRQSTKEGPNKGREYYVCTKSYQGCGFVCWKEQTQAYNSGTLSHPTSSSASHDCFNCGQTGHWSRDCPNRSGSSISGPSTFNTSGNRSSAGGPIRSHDQTNNRNRGHGRNRARGGSKPKSSRNSIREIPDSDLDEVVCEFWD